MNARREYVQAMRKRYRAAEGRKAKSALLDELVGVAGFDRKYAITLMNQPSSRRAAAAKKRSGRPRAYRHCLSVIEVAWEALDYCCAERLHPQLLPLVTALARHAEVEVTREAREELERISRATLARRLAELPRVKPWLMRAAPHPSRILKSQVQVDRYRWNEDRPGALEVDLVEHNGGSTGGHYACTLSIVDVVTGWSARRAVMGKSQAVVLEALEGLLVAWLRRWFPSFLTPTATDARAIDRCRGCSRSVLTPTLIDARCLASDSSVAREQPRRGYRLAGRS